MPAWDLSAGCNISFNCLLIAPGIRLYLPMHSQKWEFRGEFPGIMIPHPCHSPGKQPRWWQWDAPGFAELSEPSLRCWRWIFAQPGPFLMSGTSDLSFLMPHLCLPHAVSPNWVSAALQAGCIVPSCVTPRGPTCHNISVSVLA